MLNQVSERHALSANESLLEISMDDSGGLWGFAAISNSPALDLIFSGGEVMDQLKVLVPRFDNSIDHSSGTHLFGSSGLGLFIITTCGNDF
jgi:hypothetical protein